MLRSFSEAPKLATKFHRIESPCYFSVTLNTTTLFPFTYSNGTLDIAYIDDFEAEMVTSTGNAPSDAFSGRVQLGGGLGLVQRLGPNFEAYIRAWRTTDSGTPININIHGTVQKVNEVQSEYLGNNTYQVATAPPTSDNYTSGAPVNNYRSTWVFKTPLTFTTVESGVTQYITFASRIDDD